MIVDLHCHTTASDGALSPDELIARACNNGVNLLAITDHDTLAAYENLRVPDSIQLVTGIELSCQWHKRGIHIVGLNVDATAPAMATAVQHQTLARQQRAEMIAEKLAKYGVESPLAGAEGAAGEAIVGRPHFARHLVATGFVKTEQEAFRKYLGSGKPCDIKVCWPGPQQVIDWIRDAGGTAVLAHPGKYNLTRSWLIRYLEEFSQLGGQAVEIVSGRQTPVQTREYWALSDKYGLLASMGSDFHSPAQLWLNLGQYSPPPLNFRPVWDLWQ